MKVLITGAGGFLGQGLIEPFVGKHELRLMDVRDWDTPHGGELAGKPHEKLIGSVADLATCGKALAGCDAMVIAHMASRQAGSYETPEIPYDSNVKGTANLFFAAREAGISNVVLISSTGAVSGHSKTHPVLTRDLTLCPGGEPGIYSMTKASQEIIAEFHARTYGMHVSALRVGYILSGDDHDKVVDKYGTQIRVRHAGNTDRRDIGLAAMRALETPDIGYEVMYVMSTPEADTAADVAYTRRRIGWQAQHDFTWLPLPEKK